MPDALDIMPEPVYASGRNVARQCPEAETIASLLLTALDNAAATVGHRVVADAIGAYRNDWMAWKTAQLTMEIEQAGNNISDCSTIVVDADVQAAASIPAPPAPADVDQPIQAGG